LVSEDGRFPCRSPSVCGEQLERGRGNNGWEGPAWVQTRRADTDGRLSGIFEPHWGCLVQLNFNVEAVVAGMEVDAAARLLVGILPKRGIDATAKQLMKLIKLGQRWGHFADTPLLFSISEWQELGETMWERTISGEEKEEKEIKAVRELWRTVLQTLKAMKTEREVACAAAQMLALEPGKDHTPKPGTLARVFGLRAIRGMTGITCNTIAKIWASAERGSGLGAEGGGPPEVAAREIKSKCEPDAVVRPPPGERGGVGRGSATVFRKRGGAAAFRKRGGQLVPPPEGEGEGARLTTLAPPGARPATSAPPPYPPLPPSSEASPLPTPSDGSQSELQGKKSMRSFAVSFAASSRHELALPASVNLYQSPPTGKMRLPLRNV